MLHSAKEVIGTFFTSIINFFPQIFSKIKDLLTPKPSKPIVSLENMKFNYIGTEGKLEEAGKNILGILSDNEALLGKYSMAGEIEFKSGVTNCDTGLFLTKFSNRVISKTTHNSIPLYNNTLAYVLLSKILKDAAKNPEEELGKENLENYLKDFSYEQYSMLVVMGMPIMTHSDIIEEEPPPVKSENLNSNTSIVCDNNVNPTATESNNIESTRIKTHQK